MPGFTRRELFRLGLGSTALLASGSAVPTFLARAASALAADPAAGSKGRILIVVQLDGGNDGLNTVVPYPDDAYRKYRPTLRIEARDVRKIDDRIGLHPALGGLTKLLEDQRLAIVQGVGYPNPNRSHFASMAIWHTAQLEPSPDTPGWLARAMVRDQMGAPGPDALAMHVEHCLLPQALTGGAYPVPSLDRIDQFRRRLCVPAAALDDHRTALDRIAGQRLGAGGSLLQFVERTALTTYASIARLESIATDGAADSGYPEFSALARRLKLIAQLIKAGLSTSIYYTQHGGFDTHAQQLASHGGLLRELGDSLRAFQGDLDQSGEADRVLVLIFSEFGRRLAENGSGGTDHGSAAPIFLVGRHVQAGLHGPYPNLDDLVNGDPRHAVDFRRVYSTLLGQWLGVPSAAVLGEPFAPLPVLDA
jgi:uncharacterized protein (DUF1501 family)